MPKFVVLLSAISLPALAAAPPAPLQIVEESIKAHGGAERIGKLQAEATKIKGMFFIGNRQFEFESEGLFVPPDRFWQKRISQIGDDRIESVMVENKDKGWVRYDGRTETLPESQLADRKLQHYVTRVARMVDLLTDRGYGLTNLNQGPDPSASNGQGTWAIKVSRKDRPDVILHISAKTKLLFKVEWEGIDPATGKKAKRAVVYSDHKDLLGIKRPSKAVVYKDGEKVMEYTTIEIKALEKVDDKLFEKP
jgi:hypothetical protein